MENFFSLTNITLFIALWGAILSTIKVLYDYRSNTPKLTVLVKPSHFPEGHIKGAFTLTIKAINTGRRPITLNEVGFLLPDGRKIEIPWKCTLTETTPEHDFWKNEKQLALELTEMGFSGEVNLKGYYQSIIGKIFKSKSFNFSITKALSYTE